MVEQNIKLAAEESLIAEQTPCILCVDDEEYNLEILETLLENANYDFLLAHDANEAWNILQNNVDKIDVILLDKMMPGISGIDLLKRIKQEDRFSHIPVIMQTASIGDEEATEGIESGAYYYVTKPYSADMLLSIVKAALKDHQQVDNLNNQIDNLDTAFESMQEATFRFKSPKQAREIATYLSHFAIDPSRVIVGLTALLVNAIEHGNLEIGTDLKQKLIEEGVFQDEVTKRLNDPKYIERDVTVSIKRANNYILIKIIDCGNGFKWEDYIDFDPSRISDPTGRGIAMANIMNPGAIEFMGAGNIVTYKINIGKI